MLTTPILPLEYLDISGSLINPSERTYAKEMIHTRISTINVMIPLLVDRRSLLSLPLVFLAMKLPLSFVVKLDLSSVRKRLLIYLRYSFVFYFSIIRINRCGTYLHYMMYKFKAFNLEAVGFKGNSIGE